MTASRPILTTFLALVALSRGISAAAEPPADGTYAEAGLTPRDFAQGLPRIRVSYGRPATTEGRDAATTPAISPRGAQTIVESDSPREPDLVLSDEPLLRVGMLDGPGEYLFGDVSGAVRLEDGSVVVADEQSREVRMFDAGGGHVWTSGREGLGPGEYRGLWLLRGCTGAAVTVYDWRLKRITELDSDGGVADTRALRGAGGPGPYGAPACSPGGNLVFNDWPGGEGDAARAVGEYRWEMSLSWERDDGVATLRTGIPGTELHHHGGGISAPVWWGKDMAFAVTATGVWYGSADDYQLEHVDWNGRVTRVARWSGPDLEVTREHLNRYRDSQLARYETAEERQRYERDTWPEIRDDLPERLPAYASRGLLPLPDGGVWVVPHPWRDLGAREFHLLGPDGTWLHRLTIPADRTLLDAGPGWVLLLEEGDFDEQSVAVYELVEGT